MIQSFVPLRKIVFFNRINQKRFCLNVSEINRIVYMDDWKYEIYIFVVEYLIRSLPSERYFLFYTRNNFGSYFRAAI